MTDAVPPEPPPPFAPGLPAAPVHSDALAAQSWQAPRSSATPSGGIPLGVMLASLFVALVIPVVYSWLVWRRRHPISS